MGLKKCAVCKCEKQIARGIICDDCKVAYEKENKLSTDIDNEKVKCVLKHLKNRVKMIERYLETGEIQGMHKGNFKNYIVKQYAGFNMLNENKFSGTIIPKAENWNLKPIDLITCLGNGARLHKINEKTKTLNELCGAINNGLIYKTGFAGIGNQTVLQIIEDIKDYCEISE